MITMGKFIRHIWVNDHLPTHLNINSSPDNCHEACSMEGLFARLTDMYSTRLKELKLKGITEYTKSYLLNLIHLFEYQHNKYD